MSKSNSHQNGHSPSSEDSDTPEPYQTHEIGDGAFGIVTKIGENKVVKKYKKYDDDDPTTIIPSSIKELIILSQFNTTNMITLTEFKIDSEFVELYMPDGGVNLFDLVSEIESTNLEEDLATKNSEDKDNYKYHNCKDESYKNRINDLHLILAKIVPVLYYLHSNGIIHNDMKPDNILLHNQTHSTNLIDFSASVLHKAFYSKCNYNFMAPEALFDGKVTTKSDMWGLGVTCLFYIFNMLICDRIGPMPPESHERHIRNYLKAQSVKSEYLGFDEAKLSQNKPILNIIKSMLHFDPKKRISSVELFHDPLFYNHKIEKGIQYFHFKDITPKYENSRRKESIELIYKICNTNNIKICFLHSVWIYDLFCRKHKVLSENEKLIVFAVLIISCSINDVALESFKYSHYIADKSCKKAKKALDPVITDIINNCVGKLYIRTFEQYNDGDSFNYEAAKNLVLSNDYFDRSHKDLLGLYNKLK